MVNSCKDVVGYAEKHKVRNRLAAYMLAIGRVAFALKPRGIYAGRGRSGPGSCVPLHAADAAVSRDQAAGSQRSADVPAGRFLRIVLRRRCHGGARTRNHAYIAKLRKRPGHSDVRRALSRTLGLSFT